MQNRQLIFSPRKPYDLVAERHACRQAGSEANSENLKFPVWWTWGESDPRLIHAMDPYYHYTTGPCCAKASQGKP